MGSINTIYIISKNRPECNTAKILTELKYPGKWFICCQEDEEFLADYIENWGEDKVLTYDYYEEVKNLDLFDIFDGLHYGCSPARNGANTLAKENGEKRYWISDDDIYYFQESYSYKDSYKIIRDGDRIYRILKKFSTLADNADLDCIALGSNNNYFSTDRYSIRYDCLYLINKKTESELKYNSRLTEDVIYAILAYHIPRYLNLRFNMFVTKRLEENKPLDVKTEGGLEAVYNEHDSLHYASYVLLANPLTKVRKTTKGDYITYGKMNNLAPKILRGD